MPRISIRDAALVVVTALVTWVSADAVRDDAPESANREPSLEEDTRLERDGVPPPGVLSGADNAQLRLALNAALSELAQLRSGSSQRVAGGEMSPAPIKSERVLGEDAVYGEQVDESAPDVPAEPQRELVDGEGIVGAVDLVNRGVSVNDVASFQSTVFTLSAQRAELAERAREEGWANSSRYSQAIAALDSKSAQLREQVGDANYDHYLYAAGLPNRLVVSALQEESPAAAGGLREGDVIVSYNGTPIYGWGDLRTLAGDDAGGAAAGAGLVRVVRDGSVVELRMSPGTFGYQLEPGRYEPAGS